MLVFFSYVVHPRPHSSEMAAICASVVGQTVFGHSSAGQGGLLRVSSAHSMPSSLQEAVQLTPSFWDQMSGGGGGDGGGGVGGGRGHSRLVHPQMSS